MAEEKTTKKIRLAKKSETVRERADKAVLKQNSSQPRRLQTTQRRISAPFRFVGRQFAKLGKFKFFRIIGYILMPPYFRNSWKELRQVTWLTLPMSLRLTTAVFMFAFTFGLLIAVTDFGLDKLFKQVLLK